MPQSPSAQVKGSHNVYGSSMLLGDVDMQVSQALAAKQWISSPNTLEDNGEKLWTWSTPSSLSNDTQTTIIKFHFADLFQRTTFNALLSTHTGSLVHINDHHQRYSFPRMKALLPTVTTTIKVSFRPPFSRLFYSLHACSRDHSTIGHRQPVMVVDDRWQTMAEADRARFDREVDSGSRPQKQGVSVWAGAMGTA